jgi:hypothetical protein
MGRPAYLGNAGEVVLQIRPFSRNNSPNARGRGRPKLRHDVAVAYSTFAKARREGDTRIHSLIAWRGESWRRGGEVK